MSLIANIEGFECEFVPRTEKWKVRKHIETGLPEDTGILAEMLNDRTEMTQRYDLPPDYYPDGGWYDAAKLTVAHYGGEIIVNDPELEPLDPGMVY